MKTILTTLCLLVGLSAFGQGTAIRAINGLGTNTTIYDGLTLRPGAAAANRGITNIGPMLIYLGAGSLGSVLNIMDTNLTGRLQIQGHNIYLNDTNGASQLRVTSLGVELPTGPISGDGSGLTNLIGATNFSSSVTYNFNGKVTFNSVSYNTNLWSGPTNTLVLTTNYQDFITTTDCNITNVGGQLAGQNTWTTLTISNASAGDITVRSTAAGLRPQGSSTTAALVIGAGKEGILSYLSRDFKSTNYVTTAQQ